MKTSIKSKVIAVSVAAASVFQVVPAQAFTWTQEVTQLVSWAAQYVQMVEEYRQLQETYRSLNGARGMGNLVNNAASRKYLPSDYNQIMQQGYGNWQALRSAIDAPVSGKNLDRMRRDALAIDEATTQEAYRQASRRMDDIQRLLDTINSASDNKAILDLQGRIQAEQVMMANERNKLAMLENLQAIQQRKFQEQAARNSQSTLRLDQKQQTLANLERGMR